MDDDANDRGMLRLPFVAVPLATLTGWKLREPSQGAEGELMELRGRYLPLPRTADERTLLGDPRRSIAERYGSFDEYRRQVEAAAARLVAARYLLAEDVPRYLARAEKHRPIFASPAP